MNDYWEALHWSISSGRLFPFALGLSAVMAMAGVAAIYRLRGKTYEQWSSLNIDAQRPVFTGIVIALALLYPSMSASNISAAWIMVAL